MATPEIYDIELYRGDDFIDTTFTLSDPDTGTPINLTGCTIRAQIRASTSDPTTLGSFTISNLDAVNGKFQLTLTAAQTSTLNITSPAVYDIEVTTSSGVVTTYVKGAVTLDLDVSHS